MAQVQILGKKLPKSFEPGIYGVELSQNWPECIIVYFNLFTQMEHFSEASEESLYSPTNSYIELKYLSMKSL